MDDLMLENVRCFSTAVTIPLRPLTFLVGENSTGKTTILAATHLASKLMASAKIDFNEEPFNLGAYDQICSSSPDRDIRARVFRIGCTFQSPVSNSVVSLLASFTAHRGQPRVATIQVRLPKWDFTLSRPREDGPGTLVIHSGETDYEKTIRLPHWGAPLSVDWVSYVWRRRSVPRAQRDSLEIALRSLPPPFHPQMTHTFPTAPIRTKPERTYDPRNETPRPQGEHVPMVLSRILSSRSHKMRSFKNELNDFGTKSGLFSSLSVKRFGKTASDPFQLLVGTPAGSCNLIDVGYGVSQVLPILVDVLTTESLGTFLLQQPEVHLHPRAQAQLGTLFSNLAATTHRQFIIETHSDYIIDRVRLDIRDRTTELKASDVVILYCEKRPNGAVTVHPIEIDNRGEIPSAPSGYRDFFLREQARLFGVP